MTQGDRDIWLAALSPQNTAAGGVFHLPVRRRSLPLEYGDRAIGNAALLLRAMLRSELILGASPNERLFTCLMVNGWGQESTEIRRWDHMSIDPAEWRRAVTTEVGQKMHLGPN
jgi:hypothetical protein